MIDKKKKIWIIISIVAAVAIIGTVIGVLLYQANLNATRTIKEKVGTHYVNCYGIGTPTIVFEAGLDGTNEDWSTIQPEISKIARTFSYDRTGIGQSDKAKLPVRSTIIQVSELHALLKEAKVKPPYILVAHSVSGYNARVFASTYSEEVAGIVFVDSSNEAQFDKYKTVPADEYKEIKDEYKDAEQTLEQLTASASMVKEIMKKSPLKNIPITVLYADEKDLKEQLNYKTLMDEWAGWQKELAAASTKSKLVFVEDCGHYMQFDQPAAVIDAIKELIGRVKTK